MKLLYNAEIINESCRFKGFLEIGDDGLISNVCEGDAPESLIEKYGAEARDLGGNMLLPGVIDSHVHFREPGLTHKADIFSESRAAIAGGVTSYMEMPNTNPSTTTIEALNDKYELGAKYSAANYSFYIGATNSNIEVLKQVDFRRVPGIKLFMGSSTGGMLVDGEDSLDHIFSLPALIAVHCEEESVIRENVNRIKALYGDEPVPVQWHPEIRSALACYSSTARAVDYAKRHNARLHVMHLTTAQEVDLIASAPENITAEACIAHLVFTDNDYATLGTKIKCNPAVKSVIHREAIREGVRTGTISTVSTDHAPHLLSEKQGDALRAPSGMPMVQFSLTAMMDMAMDGIFSPEMVVEKMCHNQARLFNVDRRGFIRKDYYADLVEVASDEVTTVESSTILSKCKWSPLEGRSLRTKVKTTWVNGVEVYNDKEGIKEAKAAMELRFNPA